MYFVVEYELVNLIFIFVEKTFANRHNLFETDMMHGYETIVSQILTRLIAQIKSFIVGGV